MVQYLQTDEDRAKYVIHIDPHGLLYQHKHITSSFTSTFTSTSSSSLSLTSDDFSSLEFEKISTFSPPTPSPTLTEKSSDDRRVGEKGDQDKERNKDKVKGNDRDRDKGSGSWIFVIRGDTLFATEKITSSFPRSHTLSLS